MAIFTKRFMEDLSTTLLAVCFQTLSAVHITTSCQSNNILICGPPEEEHDERSFVVICVYSWASSSMSFMSKQSLTRLDLLPTCMHYPIRDLPLHGPNQAFGYSPAQLLCNLNIWVMFSVKELLKREIVESLTRLLSLPFQSWCTIQYILK